MKNRRLPHLDMIEHYQFVTFRTADSIDDFMKRISEESIPISMKQYKIDRHLDLSNKGAHLYGEALHCLYRFLLDKDTLLYELTAFSIMPNHLHILFRQTKNLKKTIHEIKGASALQINRILGRTGTFWEKGYFDKAIRNEEHFERVYRYIANNAIKASLDDADERFYGIYG